MRTATFLALVWLVSCGGGNGGGGTPTDTGGADEAQCTPQCDGRHCGPDGCGGVCGTCPEGKRCDESGQCVVEVSLKPCCNAVQTPGCPASKEIEQCVCKVNKTCCQTSWDESCVRDVDALKCGTCCEPSCKGKECGDDGCGGSCGQCTEGKTCKDGKCEGCSCEGKQCGDDGCGHSCGSCKDDELCDPSGQCKPKTACGICYESLKCDEKSLACTGDECGDVTYEGKCVGGLVVFCDADQLTSLDCPYLSEGKLECGYSQAFGGYDCVCKPQCAGLECGNGGCWDRPDVCGKCPDGKYCDAGHCLPCTCDGRQCGDDGCGKSCGQCPEGQLCDPEHKCVPATDCGVCAKGLQCGAGEAYPEACFADDCGDIAFFGTCVGNLVLFCEEDNLYSLDCEFLMGGTCGYDPKGDFLSCVCGAGQYQLGDKCVPCTCEGRVCGDDGCGKSCGTCGAGEFCDWQGQCKKAEVSACCEPKPAPGCSDDPAVEACVCTWDKYCCDSEWDNICTEIIQEEHCGLCCLPDCAGKVCGDDGCGGSCGSCGANEWCDAGQCKKCSCGTRKCGFDECGNVCGTCSATEYCDATGQCKPCSCENRQCGDDGCGKSCGKCEGGQACFKGLCITPDLACCDEQETPGCEADPVVSGCVCEQDPYCCKNAWDAMCVLEVDEFECGVCCVPDCKDKECGDDGCGGSCGECTGGKGCSPEGKCVVCECLPDQECGTDTCGKPKCGTCPDGYQCSPDNHCVQCGCGAMECGLDPCGISCGECDNGFCDNGKCKPYVGDCCRPNETAGCEDQAIRECVCEVDPVCCTTKWDASCVAKAKSYCQACL